MKLTCKTCATPLPDGSRVSILGVGVAYGGGLHEVEEYDILCANCGKAIEAEIANITEPNRLVFEIAPELRTTDEDRINVFKLLSWFMEYSDTLALKLGAVVLRVRVEPADTAASYRLVVTSTMDTHVFLWSHENALLVGEGEDDKRLVIGLNAVGTGTLHE